MQHVQSKYKFDENEHISNYPEDEYVPKCMTPHNNNESAAKNVCFNDENTCLKFCKALTFNTQTCQTI